MKNLLQLTSQRERTALYPAECDDEMTRCVQTDNCGLYTETGGHIGIIPLNRLGKATHLTEQLVRFEVLTALGVKIAVFWDVTPCNLVHIHI